MFISDTALYFFFFVISLSGFGIRVMVNNVGRVFSSVLLWKCFRRVGVNS